MKLDYIDKGKKFDFGRISVDYAKYRDIYPVSMYKKLFDLGIGKKGQRILDLGSGTAVLPINLSRTGAEFVSADISENQIETGKELVNSLGVNNIRFKVCSAENTGFEAETFDVVTAVQCFHYFNAEKAAEEIYRVLRPDGLFCKIFMDWLPFEDDVICEMEELVLKYNPEWNGNGFRRFNYSYPKWARGKFDIDTIHSYNESLLFSREDWLGRVLTCRGVGASLSDEKVKEFETEYRKMLEKYSEPLSLKHQIHIELYRRR